jgi:hypothetical protein
VQGGSQSTQGKPIVDEVDGDELKDITIIFHILPPFPLSKSKKAVP